MFRMCAAVFSAIILAASANGALASSGYWTGFWTWYAAPAPGHWIWTWVWVAPPPGGTFSGEQLDGAQPKAGADGCCSITIENFGGLNPSSVTFTGALAKDFLTRLSANNNVLELDYIGDDLFTPGQPLGTMVIDNPDVVPNTTPPKKLDFRMELATTEGIADVSGVITSAPGVPEPAEWAMLLTGLAGLGVLLRRARASGLNPAA